MRGGIKGEPRPRRGNLGRYRPAPLSPAPRLDAEIDRAERKAERRRQANRRDVDTPDYHDLDHELHWPTWRLEVKRLAERCQSNFVLVRVG